MENLSQQFNSGHEFLGIDPGGKTPLKSGYLLGANPRKQFLAQFLGIFAGALVIVPAFYLIIPTPAVLGGVEFPAPTAQVWKGVAGLLAQGLSSLGITEGANGSRAGAG